MSFRTMKIMPIIFFFSLVLTVLLAAHVFVWMSLVRFLELGAAASRFLGLGFVFLTIGFVGSALYSHYIDSATSESVYLLTSFWLGFFSNLFWAVIIYWPLYLVFQSRFKGNLFLAVMLFLLAGVIIMTIFGIWNAGRINYRQETITVKDLPAKWQGKKVAHLSDSHLNNIHNEKLILPIIERLNQEGVSAVFLTGDYFDGMGGQLDALAAPLKKLKAEKGIYFVSGNHEMYMGVQKAYRTLSANGVSILNDKKVEKDGLSIVGVEFPERDGLRRDLVEAVERLDVQQPSILLYHDPRQVEELAETSRISLMLSGHTHNGQIAPYNYVVRWIYGKYARGRNQASEMQVFISIGAGTWGPPMRTTGRPEVVIITLE